MVSSTSRPHFIPGKDPVPILQEAGWAPGPVWTGGKSRPHRDFCCCKYTFIVPSVDKYNGYVGGNSVVWCVRKIVLVFRNRDNYCFVSHGPK